MTKRILSIAFAGLILFSLPAASDELNYNFFELGYADISIDNGPDGDGFALGGSFEVGKRCYILAEYGDFEFDPDLDATEWDLGFGFHRGIGERGSFFVDVAYVDVELDSFDDDGFAVGGGVRFLFANNNLELNGEVNYVDLSDAGDDTGFGVGLLWNISERFAIGGGYATGDDADTITVGARLYWGTD